MLLNISQKYVSILVTGKLLMNQTAYFKIVDVSISDGVSYMSSHFLASRQITEARKTLTDFSSVLWPEITKQCANMMDGGAPFYRAYTTKDEKHIAVGALEPHFYSNLLKVCRSHVVSAWLKLSS